MIAYPWGALFVGLMLCLAGCLTMGRHMLLEPFAEHYPKAPKFVRMIMFFFAATLLFLGLQFIWAFMVGKPDIIPPQPSPPMQLLSTALVFYEGSMLTNIVRQRYTVEVWQRLNRINDILRCNNGNAIKRWFSI